MKTRKCYLILAIITGILCSSLWGKIEVGPDASLIGQVNPTLAGINKLQVVILTPDDEPNKDSLVFKELQAKVKDKLKESGISIAPDSYVPPRVSPPDIPELRVHIEMLEIADAQLYVFRIQISLATKVYLEKQKLFFKAEAWQSQPIMQSASVQAMPAAVTNAVLQQLQAFIHAYFAVNPQGVQPSDLTDTGTVSPTTQKQPTTRPRSQTALEDRFIASKNSKVFHRPDCRWAKKIKPENLISYNRRIEATKADRRPCKICKP